MNKELYSTEFKKEITAHQFDGTNENPALYVGTYGKYNDGSIAGMWVDLTTFADYDEFIEFCRKLHADEADPELMFQDYQGFPKCWYSECLGEDDFDKILAYSELDDDDKEMYEKYMEYYGNSDADFESAQDAFCGIYDSKEDFAEETFNECWLHEIPEHLQYYIDYAKYARDLFMDGYDFVDGYVFRNC